MSGKALGIIETVGMAAAVEAADSCVKSANVTLIGYELTRGRGLVTIKIEGNVGAVKAAINAAKVSAGKVNKVYSSVVIPRPAKDLDSIIKSKYTVGLEKDRENLNSGEEKNSDVGEKPEEKKSQEVEIEYDAGAVYDQQDEKPSEDEKIQEENSKKDKKEDKEVCNICHDPKCPRRKGQPRNLCIHYKKTKEIQEGDRE
ncbi:MAG TPA: microcompartment protein [Clostridium sp.]|jgi:microcompartment protein CcmL/EutN|uniref:BMC domain-containing protein n=1 Tax=Clostridium lapidicellarium TaxID=3240931 RepID=A0ABV4DUX7_9CLOT|nr:BMC domain-containing protein [uncultured Clostridium sp.]NLU07340.1 BMC domain-containing protein [Clostridiales bacterium]HBC96179.1 microcompartment protein [Clostridium sp.]